MAVATLALLLALVPSAAAQPLRPALKQAQCPVGSMQSGGYCTPLLRNAPPSTEKRGLVPRSPLVPRKAFRLSPDPPLESLGEFRRGARSSLLEQILDEVVYRTVLHAQGAGCGTATIGRAFPEDTAIVEVA
jgi:hypothetical protein